MHALVRRDAPALAQLGAEVLHEYPRYVLVRLAPGTATDADGMEPLPGETVHVNGQPLRVPDGAYVRDERPRSVLRFAGPVASEWVRRLEALGAQLHFWCPPFGACVEIPADVSTQTLRESLPALAGLQPYVGPWCTRALAGVSRVARAGAGQPRGWVDVVCFRETDREPVAEGVRRLGGETIALSKYKLRVRYRGALGDLWALRGVKLADAARAPVLAWDPLLAAAGAPADPPAPGALTGQGQIVAVADSGLDRGSAHGTLHEDFAGRVRFLKSWPINPSWDAYVTEPGADDGAADANSGHGTHVAGLVLGSGARSAGRYRGLAPRAELVLQAIEQYTPVRREHANEISTGYYLSGRPLDLRELFQEARDQGARIHVNAWGDPARGAYTDDSYEADLFLWKNPDALVLFAAGNEGADRDGDRELDRASLYAPASAKNVLTVGATEGPVGGVGYRGTWEGFDPQRARFRHRADRGERVSGRPERVALISSTGPTSDGRIKPDLCCPGTNLPAPRSQATGSQGWGLASPMPHYMYLGGTSMATGVAGGAAALVRQAWEQALGKAPSGPALKALLIHGALPVARRDGRVPEATHVAGFGRLNIEGSLPGAGAHLVDRAADGLATGAVHTEHVRVASAGPFRAVLAWYDAPGETLVNDLDLCLVAAGAARTWGNHPSGAAGQPDRVNTVERIDLPALAPGEYTIEIIAANAPAGPQGFALVHSAEPLGGAAAAATHPAPAPAATPARPDATGPGLPVAWMKGVGSTYRRRLEQAGVGTVSELIARDPDDLAGLLGVSAGRLRRLRGRLATLRDARAAGLSPGAGGITLADLGRTTPPAGFAAGEWARLRAALRPLQDVFDRSVHARVRLEQLFNGT